MTAVTKDIKIDCPQAISFLDKLGFIKKQHRSKNEESATESLISTNSREISCGDIFIAYRGESVDGHDFISDVCKKKPALIIIEDESAISKISHSSWLLVENSREAWSYLCAKACGFFENDMEFIGVTGTNGKTSTVWIVKEILKKLAIPHISIGTLGIWINEDFVASKHTTPDPNVLFPLLANARARGIKLCVMEVSSHAMVQKKLSPIRFKASAFTSFSRDHLDLHGSMENYLEAKLSFFKELQFKDSFKLFHKSLSELTRSYQQETKHIRNYGIGENLSYEFRDGRSELTISCPEGSRVIGLPFIGSFLIENAYAAIAMVEAVLKLKVDEHSLIDISPIPGRLEPVICKNHPMVVIDYAHTPDAIEKSLQTLRPFCSQKLWIVFGCGGDRDQGKRPLMAQAAEKFADKIIVTSDNPRFENPEDIIQGILKGFNNSSKVTIELDRKIAIETAIDQANKDDLILIAGKGHEDYMEVSGKKIDFDDKKIAQAKLNS